MKYENNANSQYLKNELSTNLNWNKQLLIERGTNPHDMNANLPVFTLKDNLLLMRKYGKRLYSFESKNIMEVRPQQLTMDTLNQKIINIITKPIIMYREVFVLVISFLQEKSEPMLCYTTFLRIL